MKLPVGQKLMAEVSSMSGLIMWPNIHLSFWFRFTVHSLIEDTDVPVPGFLHGEGTGFGGLGIMGER